MNVRSQIYDDSAKRLSTIMDNLNYQAMNEPLFRAALEKCVKLLDKRRKELRREAEKESW